MPHLALAWLAACSLFQTPRPQVDTRWGDTSVPDTDTDTDTAETGDTGPPDLARFEVSWVPGRVTLTITEGTGAYRFGMAGTGAGAGGWYGEDCLEGAAGYVYCHELPATGGSLDTVAEPWLVVSGQSTLLDANQASSITYAVWNEAGACRTWGHGPAYYRPHDCEEVVP